MLQRLAVTNPKNDKMDPHGVNPTLSIFLPTPFPVAMQGLGATAPWEKDLRIPCLEIIVFTNWKTGIGLSKRVLSKVICKIILPRIHCFDQMENWNRTFKKRVVKKETQDFRRLLFIHQIKIRMLKGLSIGRFQSWQKVRKFKIVNRINGSKYQLSYIKKIIYIQILFNLWPVDVANRQWSPITRISETSNHIRLQQSLPIIIGFMLWL